MGGSNEVIVVCPNSEQQRFSVQRGRTSGLQRTWDSGHRSVPRVGLQTRLLSIILGTVVFKDPDLARAEHSWQRETFLSLELLNGNGRLGLSDARWTAQERHRSSLLGEVYFRPH